MFSKSVRPSAVVAVTLTMLASFGVGVVRGQAPATRPAGTTGGAEQFVQIMQDLQKAGEELEAALGSIDNITDPVKRAEVAPKALPILRRLSALSEKMGQSSPMMTQQAKQMQARYRVLQATLGDPDARHAMETAASDTANSSAHAELLLVEWLTSDSNEEVQNSILDRATTLANQQSDSSDVTMLVMTMSQLGAANQDLEKRAQTIASGMNNDLAAMIKTDLEAQSKLATLENEPLTITGTTIDGKAFTTERWKGKVILVDFWATWSPLCLAELPRLKKAYAEHHQNGLEILGISNDYHGDELKQFLRDHPDMPWPQLFEEQFAKRGEWHPITMGYGIRAIPVMFLIDKKGICRTVDARKDFEELIPRLLSE